MAGSNWILDKSRSNIRFKVRHLLVANVQGEFRDFDLEITEKADSIKNSAFRLAIKTASIYTRHSKRDEHLKSADFLDSEDHPEIVFESDKIIEHRQDGYKIKGKLTVKGISKDQVFYSTFEKGIDDETYGNLSIEADLNRNEYGITWNNLVDEKWPLVDDTIKLYGNISLLKSNGSDRVKGLAGRADVYGNNNYQLYSSKSGKYNGTFSWSQTKSDQAHWIFGICTGDSQETHFRALKTKLYVENLAREYDHVISPSQFLRILHFSTLEDNFLARSSYDNNTYSLDTAYFMIDRRNSKIKYSSARLHVILLKKDGLKLYPKNNISIGFPYYNVGALQDHVIPFETGDTLVVFNEELLRQQGGANGKKLGAKSVAGLLNENKQKNWESRTAHIEKVLNKWVGNGDMEEILVAQIKL